MVFNTGDGEPTIQINVPPTSENGCTPYVYVDGEERDVESFGVGDESVQVQKVLSKDREGFILYYHGSKVGYRLLTRCSQKIHLQL